MDSASPLILQSLSSRSNDFHATWFQDDVCWWGRGRGREKFNQHELCRLYCVNKNPERANNLCTSITYLQIAPFIMHLLLSFDLVVTERFIFDWLFNIVDYSAWTEHQFFYYIPCQTVGSTRKYYFNCYITRKR